MERAWTERFWRNVAKTESCWLWTGTFGRKGYGQFYLNGRRPMAHRVAYELAGNVIPTGMTIDHLCRNTSCVNPSHLEPVTGKENILRGTSFSAVNSRKTHCTRGHEFTPENTYHQLRPIGRGCRECKKRRDREFRCRQIKRYDAAGGA